MIRNAKLSYQVTKNVAIYALSLGKFLDVRKYACVKDFTNIMSGFPNTSLVFVEHEFIAQLTLNQIISLQCLLSATASSG